jgi:hypothetical protein
MGNFWLGIFIGFLITLFLGLVFPFFGHLGGGFIGGIAAGFIAKGRRGRGALAGFLAGIFGGMLIAVFAVVGLALTGTLTEGGALIGLIGGLAELSVHFRSACVNNWRTNRLIDFEIKNQRALDLRIIFELLRRVVHVENRSEQRLQAQM